MKKTLKCILLIIGLLLLGGCNNMENANIYTTTYPLEYLIETLYKGHGTVSSIYPDGTNVEDYNLTEKQIETYSKGSLFVYNGTTKEKQLAKDFVNTNKKLKVIDAAYSLKYTYGPEELWLSPSNYLMLATNVKNNLEDLIGSKYLNEEINNNYKVLEEELSIMDANIRSIAKEAKERGKNTIVASSNVFKFLENYGFNVISLEEYETNAASLTTLKNHFKAGTYKYLLVENTEATNDKISEITSSNGTTIIINMMNTLTEENRKNNDTYFTIMNNFINNLKTITNY